MRFTTDAEVTYCEIQVNYHQFIHPCGDVKLTKTLKRLLFYFSLCPSYSSPVVL